jgi:hypothetical protein
MTDVLWRDLFGDESGVVGDMDGTAYALSLPGSGDIVTVGSTTQASLARVAGFAHRIPQSSPDTITIPAAVGSTRTDIIGLRYDPTYTGLPGPVRLYRTVGSSAAIPTYDDSPPGVEDLPLFAITRAVGQALSLATVTRMYPRVAPTLNLPATATRPTSSPLGSYLIQGSTRYVRDLNPSNVPEWRQLTGTRTIIRAYGAGARISPSGTFTDSGAMSFTGVRTGQQFLVMLTEAVRVDGSGVQTVDPGIVVTGATIAFQHNTGDRIPSPASDVNEFQIFRNFIVSATGSTVTINPTLSNGSGAPDLVMFSATLMATLTEAI